MATDWDEVLARVPRETAAEINATRFVMGLQGMSDRTLFCASALAGLIDAIVSGDEPYSDIARFKLVVFARLLIGAVCEELEAQNDSK